jgi:hypothetical protein
MLFLAIGRKVNKLACSPQAVKYIKVLNFLYCNYIHHMTWTVLVLNPLSGPVGGREVAVSLSFEAEIFSQILSRNLVNPY